MERGGRDESSTNRQFTPQPVAELATSGLSRYFCHSCSIEFNQPSNSGASTIACTNCGSEFIEEVNSDLDLQIISNQIHRLLTIMSDYGEVITVQQNPPGGNAASDVAEDPMSLARRLILLDDSDLSTEGGSSQSSINSFQQAYVPLISSIGPSLQPVESDHSGLSNPGQIASSNSSGQRLRRLIRSMMARGRRSSRGSSLNESTGSSQATLSGQGSSHDPHASTRATTARTSSPPVSQSAVDRARNQSVPVDESGLNDAESGRLAGRQISPTEAIVSGASSHGSRIRMEMDPEVLAVSAIGIRRVVGLPVGRIEDSNVIHIGGGTNTQGNDQQLMRRNIQNEFRSASLDNDLIERRRLSDGQIELIRDPGMDQNLVLLLSLISRLSRQNDQGSTVQIQRSGSANGATVGHLSDYAFSTSAFERILTQFLNELNDTGPSPASSSTINNLAVVPVTEQLLDMTRQCSVCMEDFALTESVNRLPCHHIYHTDCIRTWLQLHGTCPVCRLNLPEVSASKNKEQDVEGSGQETSDTVNTALEK